MDSLDSLYSAMSNKAAQSKAQNPRRFSSSSTSSSSSPQTVKSQANAAKSNSSQQNVKKASSAQPPRAQQIAQAKQKPVISAASSSATSTPTKSKVTPTSSSVSFSPLPAEKIANTTQATPSSSLPPSSTNPQAPTSVAQNIFASPPPKPIIRLDPDATMDVGTPFTPLSSALVKAEADAPNTDYSFASPSSSLFLSPSPAQSPASVAPSPAAVTREQKKQPRNPGAVKQVPSTPQRADLSILPSSLSAPLPQCVLQGSLGPSLLLPPSQPGRAHASDSAEKQFIHAFLHNVLSGSLISSDGPSKRLNSSETNKSAGDSSAVVQNRVTEKVLTLDNTKRSLLRPPKGPRKTVKKRKCSKVTARVAKTYRLHDITLGDCRFQTIQSLNAIWRQYLNDLIQDSTSKDIAPILMKADMHGAFMQVVVSKRPELVGFSGLVLQETENVFRIVDDKDLIKAIPKDGSIFRITVDDAQSFDVDGAFRGVRT